MKKKALYIVAVFGLILTTACGNPKLKNGEEVIAKINGKEYTANDLYKELKGQYGYNTVINWIDSVIADKEVETTDEIKKQVDDDITYYQQYASAYQMTLPQFASSYMGLNNINSEKDLRDFLLKSRKLNAAVEKQVAAKVKDSEAKDYYDENYKTVYNYKEIVLANDDDAKSNIKKIKSELKGLKNDKLVSKFEELAKKYSTNKDKITYENATKNTVSEKVWKQLKKLDDKEVTDEIEVDSDYHFILKVSKGKAKDFKDVKEEIKKNIAQEKLSKDQYLSYDVLIELRNKYKLVFFDSDLKKGYDDFKDQLAEAKDNAKKSNNNNTEEK